MTIRVYKGGAWYKLGDWLPYRTKPLVFCYQKDGVENVRTGPEYNPTTGELTEGDGLMGLCLRGVFRPFLTLDNSTFRRGIPAPIHITHYGLTPEQSWHRHAIITEPIVVLRKDYNTWVGEKNIRDLQKTIIGGSASDFVGTVTFTRAYNGYIPYGWTSSIESSNQIQIYPDGPAYPYLTYETNALDYLIKVIA